MNSKEQWESIFGADDPEMIMSVMLPAEKIPEYSIVTKKTGTYEYTLRRNIKVHTYTVAKAKDQEELTNSMPKVLSGLFMVNERGDITQVQPDTVLVWKVGAFYLYSFLREQLDGPPQ